MKIRILKILILLCVSSSAIGQTVVDFRLGKRTTQDGDIDRSGLIGNGVTDLRWNEQIGTLLVGTGFGLGTSTDNGSTWINYTSDDYGGQGPGGTSGMDVGPDGTIWIAVGYDTLVEEGQSLQIGGGLRYLEPGSSEWVNIPQPVDSQNDTVGGMQPTTTRVQNISFDVLLVDTNEVWIASWGGGVRRSTDRGENWDIITTDGLPFAALPNLNHIGFSLLKENGNIWVGTAGGMSRSNDGGQTWRRFTSKNQSQAISGNWVIGMWHNAWNDQIWATTLSTDTSEFTAISRTANGGETWDIQLREELSDGTFPRSVAFYDSAVYVATEKGVFKTIDDGQTWFLIPAVRDNLTGEGLFTSSFFSVATSPAAELNHRLWAGSADGLGMTANNGFDWTVFRSFISTRDRTDPAVYAYPNPFSPLHSDRPCRFQFDLTDGGTVNIDIYNYAMERVTTISENQNAPVEGSFDRSMTWDGKDSNGRLVDNGVYFFRAKVGSDVSWGKIVVIN